MSIEHVMQQDDYGCGIACVAMLAGISYEEAAEIMPDHCRLGTSRQDQINALNELGFRCIQYVPSQMAQGRVFLIAVPSLNVPGGQHDIVIDWANHGEQIAILDPNNGREGRKVYGIDADLLSYSEVVEVIKDA